MGGRGDVEQGKESGSFSVETYGWAHRHCCVLMPEEAYHILSLGLEIRNQLPMSHLGTDSYLQSPSVVTCL